MVSFETIEHLAQQEQMLDEFCRVLRADGVLLLSSPDKVAYSDATGYDNPFHVRELYREQLLELLEPRFGCVRLLGQAMQFHSVLWPLDEPGKGAQVLLADGQSAVQAASRPAAATYYVALCAQHANSLPSVPQVLAVQ